MTMVMVMIMKLISKPNVNLIQAFIRDSVKSVASLQSVDNNYRKLLNTVIEIKNLIIISIISVEAFPTETEI